MGNDVTMGQNGTGTGAEPGKVAVTSEISLGTEVILIERKTFVFSLKENPRGRFLRITEDVRGRRDSIIVPAPGLEEFRKALVAICRVADSNPHAQAGTAAGGP